MVAMGKCDKPGKNKEMWYVRGGNKKIKTNKALESLKFYKYFSQNKYKKIVNKLINTY